MSARRLRAAVLVAMLLVLAQCAIGIVVNLYVAIPARHPGAHPSNYFAGSLRSIGWALGDHPLSLAIHAALGLALVLVVIWVLARSASLHRRTVTGLCALGALLVIGAGFNGASFLDFNENTSSLIMALLAFASLACYATVLATLADSP